MPVQPLSLLHTIFSIQFGNTALHMAAINNDVDIALFLLERGARIHINNVVKWADIKALSWFSSVYTGTDVHGC